MATRSCDKKPVIWKAAPDSFQAEHRSITNFCTAQVTVALLRNNLFRFTVSLTKQTTPITEPETFPIRMAEVKKQSCVHLSPPYISCETSRSATFPRRTVVRCKIPSPKQMFVGQVVTGLLMPRYFVAGSSRHCATCSNTFCGAEQS